MKLSAFARHRTAMPAAPRDDKFRAPVILLVDDDPDLGTSIELRLKNIDVRILRRYTGMQGIAAAIEFKPDLIITDLSMPCGDGQALIDCLQGNAGTAGIPVLVLTGRAGADLARRLDASGASAVLRKPVHHAELLQAISEHVELREISWAELPSHLHQSQA